MGVRAWGTYGTGAAYEPGLLPFWRREGGGGRPVGRQPRDSASCARFGGVAGGVSAASIAAAFPRAASLVLV